MYLMISGRTPGEGCRSQRSAAPCLIPGGGAYYCSYASPKDDISVTARDRKKPKKCVRAQGTLDPGKPNPALFVVGIFVFTAWPPGAGPPD